MARALRESAPLARRLAARNCGTQLGGARDCAWYHGLWQYLRLLRIIEPMERHAAFFREALVGSCRGLAAPRILVCGAADYWMYAQALAALRACGAEPRVTVIDLCRTPLELNRWYARREGARITAVQADILQYRARERFDAICTHAFFGRFSEDARPGLAAKWKSLLRRGGAVITVTPLRPGRGDKMVSFSRPHAQELVRAVRAAAARRRRVLDVDPDELAAAAAVYASRHAVHRVSSCRQLDQLFTGAGFRLEALVTMPAAQAGASAARGPTVAGSAPYAAVVALRG